MKKYLIALAAVAAIAVAAVALAGGNKDNNDKAAPQNQNTPQPPPPASQPQENAEAGTENRVTISNFAYSPAVITVKKGTTITWTNNDSVAHTVTADTGDNGPDSELFQSGESYSFTFNDEGTFNYHCEPHPNMHGTVTVTE